MMKPYALTCLGNAIVDVLSNCTDDFLQHNNIQKGGMTLVDAARSKALFEAMGQSRQVSGGSAANTAAGFASLGGACAYMGKVSADQLGDVFAHDMKALNIHYTTPRLVNGPETARCMIFITPDAQRSMNTYLGACVEFSEDDVDADTIKNSAYIYLEGYLFDRPQAKAAYRHATKLAHAAGSKVALTLSDSFCVERHREDFLNLITHETDVLFANEAELKSLFQTENFEDAVEKIRPLCGLSVVTRSEKGAVIVTPTETIDVAPHPVVQVQDTTGAGDQFAAGFLYGLAYGYPLPVCGKLGAMAASEVISHVGPRPETCLKTLAERELGFSLKAA